jgi:hypothetical protein
MLGRVEIEEAGRGLSLPATAVLIRNGRETVVFVEREHGSFTFERRTVSVGQIVDGRAHVRAGLAAGERVAVGGARLLDGAADQLLRAVEELDAGVLSPGMRVVAFYDRSVLVGHTLGTVHHNLLEGALSCVAIVWLFLRLVRGSAIVAIVIPLALPAAFIGLHAMDLPANLISMGAIDFGILVDGAVILVEHVLHELSLDQPQTREDRIGLVTRAASRVARPTLFAMLIIMAVLVPVFSLERVEGRTFRPLALTYAFALAGVLVASLTVVPAPCALLFRSAASVPRDEPRVLRLTRTGYARAVAAWLRRRVVVAALLAGLLAPAATALPALGTEFLPELDEGDFTVFVELATSASLEVAQVVSDELRSALLTLPEVREVGTKIGRPDDGTDNESVNMAVIHVHLSPRERWRQGMTKPRLLASIRAMLDRIPRICANISQPMRDAFEEAISDVRGKLVLQVFGTDLDEMRVALLAALEAVRGVPGMVGASLYRDRNVPQLELRPSRAALTRFGLTMRGVQQHIEAALAGAVVSEVWRGERAVPVRVRFPFTEREDTSRTGDILVTSPSGARIPLRDRAAIETTPGRASIDRKARSCSMALKSNIEGRDAGSVVRDAMRAVAGSVRLPSGCRFLWGASSRTTTARCDGSRWWCRCRSWPSSRCSGWPSDRRGARARGAGSSGPGALATLPAQLDRATLHRLVLERAPRVRAARAMVRVAEATLAGAAVHLDPVLGYGGGYLVGGENVNGLAQHDVTLSQPLLPPGVRSNRRDAAEGRRGERPRRGRRARLLARCRGGAPLHRPDRRPGARRGLRARRRHRCLGGARRVARGARLPSGRRRAARSDRRAPLARRRARARLPRPPHAAVGRGAGPRRPRLDALCAHGRAPRPGAHARPRVHAGPRRAHPLRGGRDPRADLRPEPGRRPARRRVGRRRRARARRDRTRDRRPRRARARARAAARPRGRARSLRRRGRRSRTGAAPHGRGLLRRGRQLGVRVARRAARVARDPAHPCRPPRGAGGRGRGGRRRRPCPCRPARGGRARSHLTRVAPGPTFSATGGCRPLPLPGSRSPLRP